MLAFSIGDKIGKDMDPTLVRAIEERRRLRFVYNGRTRLVEPQCYGIGTRGTELLRVHQLHGGQEREPLFDVTKIADLQVLDEAFDRPGPNYKRDDSAMKTIFAQL
jgi:predicted DNA-binding transcriptional regulator YafY